MTHGSLFSGIGGFDLAAEWMGWENKFHCEWNPFGQKVLKYYWPEAESFTDITKTNFKKYADRISILTGGFPCQPYSQAGKRLGKEDSRHLWPEMCRAIREIKPRWIVGENVFGLVNWNGGMVFNEVQTDLEIEGYEVFSYVLPAAAVNAPHRRDRVWIIAHRNLSRCGKSNKKDEGESPEQSDSNSFLKIDSNPNCIRLQRRREQKNRKKTERQAIQCYASKIWNRWENFPSVSPVCDGNDGISHRLDGITFSKWRTESIKAGGNAICPQVAFQIFKAIEQYENLNLGTEESEHK